MKKKIAFLTAGVLVLSLGVYVSTKLWAQGPGAAQPPAHPQTRIGILNMAYVIRNYSKVEAYTAELKGQYKGYDDAIKDKKNKIEQYTKAASDSTQPATQREQYQKAVTQLSRELEDMNNDMKKTMGEKQDAQMVTLYREIYEAVARYSMDKGLDLVLTHIEAVNEADVFNPMNVAGKMQQRACMPLYYNKGMDISKDIVETLNISYKNKAAAPAAPAATTPTSAPTTRP